jgi:N-acetylated-alpha-linked acidic dipeptidase
MQDNTTAIWDAVGIFNGTNEDEVLIIGNHRDAWIVGGAADPNSGSAVLIELAKAFNKLAETGWKPLRTIVLCSWDAEEYGLVGRYTLPIPLSSFTNKH